MTPKRVDQFAKRAFELGLWPQPRIYELQKLLGPEDSEEAREAVLVRFLELRDSSPHTSGSVRYTKRRPWTGVTVDQAKQIYELAETVTTYNTQGVSPHQSKIAKLMGIPRHVVTYILGGYYHGTYLVSDPTCPTREYHLR